MLFDDLNFIFVFLLAFFASYFFSTGKFKKIIIVIYSLLFYLIGNINSPINIIVLTVSILINFVLLKLIEKSSTKLFLIIGILYNIALMVIFKLNLSSTVMPLGLSFYSFSFISLLVDVYKNKQTSIINKSEDFINKKESFFDYISYVLFFPKLLSGPITRYYDYKQNEINKNINLYNIIDGSFLFAIGLGFKTILSTGIFYIINQINVYGFESISTLTAWIGMYSYSMKLYFDFAGYSLIAIGIAKIIGFKLPVNFDNPFASKSISEFWRKWHITLGVFFKDYVYIPLGGNCKYRTDNTIVKNYGITEKVHMCFNLLVVWILTGLWHGFKVNFILWAMSIFLIIVLEKLFLDKIYNKCFILGKLSVIILIPVTFIFFSIENLEDIKIFLLKLIDFNNINVTVDLMVIVNNYINIFVVGLLFITRIPSVIYNKIKKYNTLKVLIAVFVFVFSIYMILISENDTFKYLTF